MKSNMNNLTSALYYSRDIYHQEWVNTSQVSEFLNEAYRIGYVFLYILERKPPQDIGCGHSTEEKVLILLKRK